MLALRLSLLAVAAATAGADCPQALWQEFDGRCYLASTLTSPWEAVAGACSFAHPLAHMASVHDAETNAFLGALTGGEPTWLGLRRQAGAASFAWEDGSTADWFDWAAGQPPAGADELCALTNFGGGAAEWGAEPCGGSHLFVCQMPARPGKRYGTAR